MIHQPRRRFELAFRDRIESRLPQTLRALVLAATTMAAFGSITAAALAAPPVYVNGSVTDIDAVVRGRQVFVPVRGVFEKLGTAVIYTPPSSVVARKANTDLVLMTLGSVKSTVKGEAHTLSNAPFRLGSRIYVPLRLISQASGATVIYTVAPHAVNIMAARPIAAAPVLVAAASPVAAAPVAQQGLPWWVWLLIGLIALALLFALMLRRRKSDPIISTRSTIDPKIRTRQ